MGRSSSTTFPLPATPPVDHAAEVERMVVEIKEMAVELSGVDVEELPFEQSDLASLV